MKKYLFIVAILAVSPFFLRGEDARRPPISSLKVYSMDPEALPKEKNLRANADEKLKLKISSVMDKPQPPASGDKHDYLSLSPYTWPNPDKPGGLPYIYKDGQKNPANLKASVDKVAFGEMVHAVRQLAMASYVIGDKKYAEGSARWLRAWFIDPATKMNPNSNYCQVVPGKGGGLGNECLELVKLTTVVDGIGLLEPSHILDDHELAQLRTWFETYLNWLRTSAIGRKELALGNNHATQMDNQMLAIALFLGKNDLAKEVAESGKQTIDAQIEPDGKQPKELHRTKSFGYSHFNLDALFLMATLAERSGVDLWHYESKDGRSIRKALDFMVPFLDPQKKWPYKQIEPFDRTEFLPLLEKAKAIYGDASYQKAIDLLSKKNH